jgi:hypothetical protein
MAHRIKNNKHDTSKNGKRYMTKEETIAFVTELFNREAD